MSAAEATSTGTGTSTGADARRRGGGLRFLRSELRLVLTRRRNQVALFVLALPPLIIALAVRYAGPGSGGDGPTFFSAITDNGLFVALAALATESGLFLPLAVAMVAGDAVAGEAQTGTLRYLLTVPVSRTRLLLVKLGGMTVFTVIACFTVSVVGMVSGVALFGGGDLALFSGTTISFAEAVLRVAGATTYLAMCLTSLAVVGLFISTLTEQPIGATIATVLVSSASFILDAIPQIDWIHPYLLTHHWSDFADLLRDPVRWDQMAQGAYVAAAYALVFGLAAWARFTTKDITT
ncbi:ABC transporter permease [Nocardioidaceae bacterium]|nr:ABC transporter permease [Nocardioidaceae bacterium]